MLSRVRGGFEEKEIFELSFEGLAGLVFQMDQRGMEFPGRRHSIGKGMEM